MQLQPDSELYSVRFLTERSELTHVIASNQQKDSEHS